MEKDLLKLLEDVAGSKAFSTMFEMRASEHTAFRIAAAQLVLDAAQLLPVCMAGDFGVAALQAYEGSLDEAARLLLGVSCYPTTAPSPPLLYQPYVTKLIESPVLPMRLGYGHRRTCRCVLGAAGSGVGSRVGLCAQFFDV